MTFYKKLSSRGFSIVETLIAVALLVIVILVASRFTVDSKKQSVKLEDNAECQSQAQSIIDNITSLGTRDNILPAYLPDTSDVSGSIQYGSLETFNSMRTKIGNYNYFATPVVDPSTDPASSGFARITNAHLILNSASFLQTLHNNDPLYCESEIHPLPSGFLSALNSQLPEVEQSLQIIPVSLDGSSLGTCPRPIYSRPSSGPYPYHKINGNPNVAYMAKAFVTFRSPQGERVGCVAQSQFQYQRDDRNNSTFNVTSVRNGAGAAGRPFAPPIPPHPQAGDFYGVFCDTDNPLEFRNIEVRFTANNVEPGSVTVCRGVRNDNAWLPCEHTLFPGQTGPTTLTLSGNTFVLRFEGLQADIEYLLGLSTVDTAGNVALPTSVYWQVDGTRPSVTNIAPVDNFIGPPEDGLHGRLAGPTSVSNWPYQNLQCQLDSARVAGSYSGSLPNNWLDCACSVGSTAGPAPTLQACIGRCQAQVRPNGHSLPTLNMLARDICGSGGGSQFTWAVSTDSVATATTHTGTTEAPVFNPTSSAPYYPLQVTNQRTALPLSLAVQCDCLTPQNNNTHLCGSTFDIAPYGCEPQADNWQAIAWNICGQRTNLSQTYGVNADIGEPCGNVSCRAGLVCAQASENGSQGFVSVRRCVNPSDYPLANDCKPPGSPSGNICEYTNSIYDCESNAIFTCRSTNTTATSSCSGQPHDSACNVRVSGVCNAADCVSSGCSTGTCSGPPVAGGAICGQGSPVPANGSLCYFEVAGTCDVTTNCSPRERNMAGFSENPICVQRGPLCVTSIPNWVPGQPDTDPCGGNRPNYGFTSWSPTVNSVSSCPIGSTLRTRSVLQTRSTTCTNPGCCVGATGPLSQTVSENYCESNITCPSGYAEDPSCDPSSEACIRTKTGPLKICSAPYGISYVGVEDCHQCTHCNYPPGDYQECDSPDDYAYTSGHELRCLCGGCGLVQTARCMDDPTVYPSYDYNIWEIF